jgi:hypothetical protein
MVLELLLLAISFQTPRERSITFKATYHASSSLPLHEYLRVDHSLVQVVFLSMRELNKGEGQMRNVPETTGYTTVEFYQSQFQNSAPATASPKEAKIVLLSTLEPELNALST